MQFKTFHNPEGAKQAKGLAVIIDVFRAFTTECYVIGQGAERIIPVRDLDVAYALKSTNPDWILMGEQHGERLKDFDYGNSPFQIRNVDFTGKTVIHISTAGTKGLGNAHSASSIITGSFVNANAVIKYIQSTKPEIVSFVCTGTDNETIRDEDAMCAEYLQKRIENKPVNFEEIKNHITSGGYIDRFLDPSITKYPVEDVDYCLILDKFDFVLKASPCQNNLIQITKYIG